MSRHPSRVGRSRDGLFWNDPSNPDAPAEVRENPLRYPCPRDAGGCGALPLERCTGPARHGRRQPIMSGYHDARRPPERTDP